MLKKFLRLLPVVAFAVAAALPVPAAAAGGGGSGGINITIGRATLQARLLASVPVTIQCTGSLADQPIGEGSVNVFIQQAFGTQMATGSGGAPLSSCPSTPMTINVLVAADAYPPSAPFHGGPAVASASAFVADPTFTIFNGGSVGPVVVRL